MSSAKGEVDRLRDLKNEIDKVSVQIAKRAGEIEGDVMTVRSDPQIKKLWNRLCRLHMEAMVTCKSDQVLEGSEVCMLISRPQACIDILHLSDEETCCGRLLRRMTAKAK